jgi:protocatechuate 3,4-dioxygenase beta subunit
MKMTRQFLRVSAAAVILGLHLHAQTPSRSGVQSPTGAAAQKYTCSGTVTDAGGHPLAGATVEYWSAGANYGFASLRTGLENQTNTAADGAFELADLSGPGFLLARKPGLASAWQMWRGPLDPWAESGAQVKLVLGPPAPLAGTVVDAAGRPVANAAVAVIVAFGEMPPDVSEPDINALFGNPARTGFAARTDAAGRFRIENFPVNAKAMLTVDFPGQTLRQSMPDLDSPDSLPWRSGQTNIQLVMDPAGVIEGRIVVPEGNQPPPAARLTLVPDDRFRFAVQENETAQAGADGSFRLGEVPAGSYRVQAAFGTNAVADWVADPVPVSVKAGQIVREVRVTASRGGLLEVTVLGENDRQPVPNARVTAFGENQSAISAGASSDSNGIARLRLQPGDYQVAVMRASMPASQTTASVEAGHTNRVEIEIPAPQTITGVVHLPDGRPAAGLPVRLVGAFGFPAADVKTDADGKFELAWTQRQMQMQPNNSTACVLVRDVEHNLAAAQDVEDETNTLDLKLAPGLTLAGRVECDGQPVTNATAQLIFWTGRSGMWLRGLARTNVPGRFEIPALPPGRKYGVVVSAPGYGQNNRTEIEASADAVRQELDPVELKPANLKLAGQVLDPDDQPVSGVNVNINGDGQPNGNTRTDHDGRFLFEHVCEGPLQVSANRSSRDQILFGNTSAEGGDTNVVLRLGQQNINNPPGLAAHKLAGTVTDPGGRPVAGAQVAVFPGNGQANWIRTKADGSYRLTWSLQQWQLQNARPLLVARDLAHNLAASEDLSEDVTNLDVKLKPGLTLAGQVQSADGTALPGAQILVWLKAGNSFDGLDEQTKTADAQGNYEVKCLPPDAQYQINFSAKGHGSAQQPLPSDSDTNRLVLPPVVLKPADQVLAGQVVDADDKPVSGANINLSGEGQPNGYMTTDSKGRFHFQVCEGQIRLFASSQSGGFAQGTAEAGDTNVVLTLGSQPGLAPRASSRAALKGALLPDLTTVNLPADAAPAGRPVLLCLFDAGQRSSRHAISQLAGQAAALQDQQVTVLGIQAVVTADDVFNDWKSSASVAFPVGRVTDKSAKDKWATSVPALPWLILADAGHHVIAEGFSQDELDAQVKKLAK